MVTGLMSEFTWTPEQVAAITSEEDTLLVANAGTGKTSTVVGKVLWQLGLDSGAGNESGDPIPPCANPCELSEIAAITFTEKGSADLKSKLRQAIEGSARADELRWQIDRAYIGTIHGFCRALLCENALRFGIEPTFRMLDQAESVAEQERVVQEVVLRYLADGEECAESLLEELSLRGFGYAFGVVDHVRHALHDLRWNSKGYEGWISNNGLNLEHLRSLVPEFDELDQAPLVRCDALFQLARASLDRWNEFLAAENVRDFDSLILELRDRLHSPGGAEALDNIRRRYRLLIIDEFQDTDFAQRDIAFAIGHKVARPQLFLVGDPKQSIYGFRSPDIAVWNETRKAIASSGSLLELSRNFRCAPPIVDFVNTTSSAAMTATAEALDQDLASSRIEYSELEAGLPDSECSAVEWLLPKGSTADEVRRSQAAQVATHIRTLTETGTVVDEGTGKPRPCEFHDIAILSRSRKGLEHVEAALSRHSIPHSVTGAGGLAERQEVLDLVNALRLLSNPLDNLCAFGYLRSPFVCLRDELIARFRLIDSAEDVSLLQQAARFLDKTEDFPGAPEHERLSRIEKESLRRGLNTVNDLRDLVCRVPLDELLDELLHRTGYRLHLLLDRQGEQALANIGEFLRFAKGHRDLGIDDFLDLWETRNRIGNGLPQAPLYSQQDNVVTISTIHMAKGLEWPVVFLVSVGLSLRSRNPKGLWSDRILGPILPPKVAERGPRAQHLVRRKALQDRAEESRIAYVATTRAKDRLVIVGEREVPDSYGAWFDAGVIAHNVELRTLKEAPATQPGQNGVSLAWLDLVDSQPSDERTTLLLEPPLSFARSASELMVQEKNQSEWERFYRHGVRAKSVFTEEKGGNAFVPGNVRGSVIHRVLERIGKGTELVKLLDEVISELVAPEFAGVMVSGTPYRAALEKEIRDVVQGDEWKWYFEGEYYSELPFVHFLASRDWRIGDLDLYRPGPEALVIDFKTHEDVTDQESAEKVAEEYKIQMHVYREAALMRSKAEARLFFTKPRIEIPFTGE
jgi:ATP-dependent helicase/nuclease subunit A